jgi:hypothetical protein
MDNFLIYLYSDLMIDLDVIDAIYEAAKAADKSEYRREIMDWYKANILGDQDDEA